MYVRARVFPARDGRRVVAVCAPGFRVCPSHGHDRRVAVTNARPGRRLRLRLRLKMEALAAAAGAGENIQVTGILLPS